MSKVTLTTDAHSHRLTLSDPPLHILDIAMLEQLLAALRGLGPDRHCLVIDSTGDKAFSAGASVQDHVGDRVVTMLALFHDCFRILSRLDTVTVAFVRGAALGGGCELALACDFVLASDRARFGQPEINLGVFPPVAAYQLSRQLAPRKGLEMLLTGDPLTAQEAQALGLANAVFPAADFDAEAEKWLTRLTRQSSSTLRMARKAFRLAQASDFEERLATVEKLYLEELMRTADAAEGLSAFMEKRKAVWRGR
ncbi:MAG TPA: enoyl-CoA hydratase-related protein [Thermoanaerobaculia bacterium]|nr:enoyl-CoA hydratase-related protein [Thermoanaerobaculia bacterium]